MAEKRDYYDVLGVDKSADEKEIKKAICSFKCRSCIDVKCRFYAD